MLAERQPHRRYPLSYQAGGGHVIAAEGELDLAAVADIERAASAVPEHNRGPIVLDLTAAKPISDAELNALCGLLRRLRSRGASVAIVGAPPRARAVFDAAALPGVTFTTTVREALIALEPVALHPGGPPPPTSLSRRRAAHLSVTEPLPRREKPS